MTSVKSVKLISLMCQNCSFQNLYQHCKATKKSIWLPLTGVLPYVYHCVVLTAWLHYCPQLLSNHLVPMILGFGLGFGNVVGRMIVAHTIHDRFPYWNINYVLPTVGAVSAAYNLLSVAQQVNLIYLSMAVSAAVHGHFVWQVIQKTCSYLKIRCFHIKPQNLKK